MKITKQQFKSFDGINELIIVHGPHVRTIDVAQHILDLQNEVVMLKDIIQDLKQREKKVEKVIDLT
jgi:UDP-2,3-diacylglucosamine pyrophosphatase LpxH